MSSIAGDRLHEEQAVAGEAPHSRDHRRNVPHSAQPWPGAHHRRSPLRNPGLASPSLLRSPGMPACRSRTPSSCKSHAPCAWLLCRRLCARLCLCLLLQRRHCRQGVAPGVAAAARRCRCRRHHEPGLCDEPRVGAWERGCGWAMSGAPCLRLCDCVARHASACSGLCPSPVWRQPAARVSTSCAPHRLLVAPLCSLAEACCACQLRTPARRRVPAVQA